MHPCLVPWGAYRRWSKGRNAEEPDRKGLCPSRQGLLDQMTKMYQQNIRSSPLRDVVERMLQQFQVKLNDRGV